jgi:hypothetical protein
VVIIVHRGVSHKFDSLSRSFVLCLADLAPVVLEFVHDLIRLVMALAVCVV